MIISSESFRTMSGMGADTVTIQNGVRPAANQRILVLIGSDWVPAQAIDKTYATLLADGGGQTAGTKYRVTRWKKDPNPSKTLTLPDISIEGKVAKEKGEGFPWRWVLLGVLLVGGGGAAYALTRKKKGRRPLGRTRGRHAYA